MTDKPKQLFASPKVIDPTPVLFKGKSAFNGNISCFEDKKYRYIQTIFKSRFPTTQTAILKNNPMVSKFKFYPASLTIALAYIDPKKVTLIGVAGGFLLNYFNRYMPQLSLTAIEIDPVMVSLAMEFFDVNHPILCGDGYQHILDQSGNDMDILILDAFQGMYIPDVFSDPDWYEHLISNVLSKQGVLVINIIVNKDTLALYELLEEKFSYVSKFHYNGNLTLVCQKTKTPSLPWELAGSQQDKYGFMYPIPTMLTQYDFQGKVSELIEPAQRHTLFGAKKDV